MMEWITIAAIILGPVLAVQAQKWIEAARFNQNQRLFIFKRLMATRGTPISPIHVEALNLIDLEFAGRSKKHKQVRTRWKEYLDNLTRLDQDPQKQKEQLPAWSEKNQELLANLLHDMGKAVGYDFDTVHLKRSAYTPIGHANMELENQVMRKLTIEVLAGKKALALDVKSLPQVQSAAPSTPSGELPSDELA
jgi:Family of unknown function (DUF6680)